MKKTARYRSHTPLSERIRWLAVLMFSSVMLVFSVWTVGEALFSGATAEFTRHPQTALKYGQQPVAFGATLIIWICLSLFFAAATLGAAKRLRKSMT
jgi:hypothetical protein